MKLRNIRGLDRLECTVMPLMVSATETAEELSAAAVTRGIENPARKTSAVSLRLSPLDFFGDAGRPGLAGALICGTIREAMTMISIDNVSFGYGEAQETLSQVSAAIAPGECVPAVRGLRLR